MATEAAKSTAHLHLMPDRSILLVYHHPMQANAPTIMEHVNAFEEYSQFAIVKVNSDYGFPRFLLGRDFDAIVLHYSLFGGFPFQLSPEWERYVRASRAPRIAFFQDEHAHCVQRLDFIRDTRVSTIYSLLDPEWASLVYRARSGVPDIRFTLTGFVSDALIAEAGKYALDWTSRGVDVGYRGRRLSRLYGKQSQEKTEIADRFIRIAAGRGLVLDIETAEEARIYGDAWYQFVGRCRFMLGVEAGVSVFDIDGRVTEAIAAAQSARPDASLDEIYDEVLPQFEGNVPYRTVSPRVFEAIAFRTALILYEGTYNGVVRPYEHYIPLCKDLSNADEVFSMMADTSGVLSMVERAYNDVIASGRYHYQSAMNEFDAHLTQLGLEPAADRGPVHRLRRQVRRWESWRRFALRIWWHFSRLLYFPFPGRRSVMAALRRFGVLPQRS